MQTNNILVISIYPFPNGMAATNRMKAYTKAMVLSGMSVEIVIPFPTDGFDSGQMPDRDTVEGVSYHYLTGRYKSKIKILRALSFLSGFRKLKGIVFSLIYIINNHKYNKYDTMIISTDGLQNLLCYSLLAKKIKMKSIFIFDEYPTPIRHKLKSKIPYWKEVAYTFVLKNVNGYISISNKLCTYYQKLAYKPSLRLPVLIDTSRFDFDIKAQSHEEYLCYMGNLELAKDNVDVIIKAFAMIVDDYPSLKLYLYGSPCQADKETLEKLILLLNLSNKVVLKGRVSNLEVPAILSNASVLVSSQPRTMRAAGGFPTKLGEYLCAGVPTLITNVGENSKYVKDNIHCYFVEPDDEMLYAEKLKFILNNYIQASEVAQSGKLFVQDGYSHIAWGNRIASFINSLHE